MRIAKVGFGVAARMRLFFDKENTTNMVGDIAEEKVVAVTGTFVAKFTIAIKLTAVFLHGILQ